MLVKVCLVTQLRQNITKRISLLTYKHDDFVCLCNINIVNDEIVGVQKSG